LSAAAAECAPCAVKALVGIWLHGQARAQHVNSWLAPALQGITQHTPQQLECIHMGWRGQRLQCMTCPAARRLLYATTKCKKRGV
jgi:hypothetical protein